MKRILFCAAVAALVTGCEGSIDPLTGVGGPPGGGAITQVQATGNWSLALRRTTTFACTGGSLPDNQVVLTRLDVTSTGAVTAATSTWQVPPSTIIRSIAGTVTFTSGFAGLTLFASGTTTSGMELRGTLTAAGTFTGTLTDPAAGLTPPVFGTTSCEYTATGNKTS